MRHSPPVGGFSPKAEEHTSSLSAAVCTGLPARVKGGCLPGFRNTCSIVLGTAQSSRIGSYLPNSQDRHGQDYAASGNVQPLTGVATTLSIRHSPGFGIATIGLNRCAVFRAVPEFQRKDSALVNQAPPFL